MLPLSSWAKKSVSWRELQPLCRERWQELPTEKWDGEYERKGVTKFVLTSRLVATQPAFAYQKFKDSEDRHLDRHGVTQKGGVYRFENFARRSLYPVRSALQVISYQGLLYIVDGHHRGLLSVYTGSPRVPVKILDDWSDLNEEQFLARAETAEYEGELMFIHMRDGKPLFINLCEMTDNPYLYLAREVTRNVRFNVNEDSLIKTDGANPFLILKTNRGIPGGEFFVASLAKKIIPNYAPGQVLTKKELNDLGEALEESGWAKKNPNVITFAGPQSMKNDEIEKEVRRKRKRVAKATCGKDLSAPK